MMSDHLLLQRLAMRLILLFTLNILAIQVGFSQYSSADVKELQRKFESGDISAEQLRALGIDLADSAGAIERARALGVPEEEIQRQIARVRASNVGTYNVAPMGASPAPIVVVNSPLTPPTDSALAAVPLPPEPIAAGGQWAGLSYFGYDIFRAGRDHVTPVEVGPVDPGYLVGTGDVLMLTLWGEVEYQYQLEINSEGNVMLPGVGQIFVAGTRLESLRARLVNYLSKYYSGLMSDPPTIFLDVTLSSLRGSQVYIMGEVERPGSYNLSAYATAFNAMYTIGGPTITGSLRDVRILREGNIAARVDMYDCLVTGVSTDDRRLMHNDIVFVPPRGKTVGIKGEVNRAGVYELKEGETIRDLIAFAGKLKPTAYAFRAQIERIVPITQRVRGQLEKQVVDVDLTSDVTAQQLADGDMVVIFPIRDKLENYVELTGKGVYRPGRFELGSIRSLSQLIVAADGLTPYAVTDRAEITRTYEDLTCEHIVVDLQKAQNNDPVHDITLQRRDTVRVFSIHDFVEPATVKLRGHVKQPGDYPLSDSLDLYSLLFGHAGLQDSLWKAGTFMSRGDIFRLEEDGRTRRIVSFDVDAVWSLRAATDLKLQDKDEIVLYASNVMEVVRRDVYAHGVVNNPNRYEWKRGMTLSDLLRESGGFRDNALLSDAEIARVPPGGLKGDSLATILHVAMLDDESWRADPEKAAGRIVRGDCPAGRFLLQPNDRVFVRPNPDFEPPSTVVITGEVVEPGHYSLRNRNETLKDIIQRSGGLTSEGYAGGGQIIRAGKRLFLNFDDLLVQGKSRENVILQPGDSIHIPPKPNVVAVQGEVMNPGYFKYFRGASVRDYVIMAGGKTDNGGKVLVQQPSGRTYECGWLRRPRPDDGAVVTVYPKPMKPKGEKTDWSGVIKDSFAIAASAATIIFLVDQVK